MKQEDFKVGILVCYRPTSRLITQRTHLSIARVFHIRKDKHAEVECVYSENKYASTSWCVYAYEDYTEITEEEMVALILQYPSV